MSRLSPLDRNFWTIHTDTTPQVIASFFPLSEPPDTAQLKTALLSQIDHFPRFRKKVVRGTFGPAWREDDQFALANHLRIVQLNDARTPDQLLEHGEKLFSAPLDLTRPPWDFTVLIGAASTAEPPLAAILFRVHHAFADGLGALEFFHRLCTFTGTAAERKSSRRAPGTSSVTTAPPVFGTHFLRSLRRLISECREEKTRSALNGTNSRERQLAVIDFPLADLRRLRRSLGGSLNDIMLAVVTGAVRRYQLAESGKLDPLKVLMPFNLRRRANIMSLGNHLTGIGVSLPIGEVDPVERLDSIRTFINRVKSDGSLGAYRLLARLNAWLPESLRKKISDAAARRANFICTNMPGPDKPVTLAGATILGNYGCAALMRGQGIAFAFISYAGKMCVSVVSDPNIVPRSQQMVGYLREAFSELHQCAADSAKSDHTEAAAG